MMILWKITVLTIGYDASSFEFYVATKTTSARTALKLARGKYADGWWDEHTISAVAQVGKLTVAEGIALPLEDYCA